MNGELEDILDCLFLLLLLIDLLAVLGRGLLYTIALGVCAVAVALHICMASVSLDQAYLAIERGHDAYLELSARCLQPCFSQTFLKGKWNRGNKEQTCAQCSKIE